MAANIGISSLDGLFDEDEQYTVNISGTVTTADVGKALTIDTTAANTFKLAGDLELVVGRLETYENRKTEGVAVGTMSVGGGLRFPTNPDAVASPGDEIPTVGDFLVGGTANAGGKGYVQKMPSNSTQPKRWLVVEDKITSDGYVVAIEL